MGATVSLKKMSCAKKDDDAGNWEEGMRGKGRGIAARRTPLQGVSDLGMS